MWIPRSVRSRKNTENRPSSGTKWPKNRERREKFKQKWGRHRRSIFNTIITLPFRNIQKAFKSHPRKDLLSPLFICLLLIHVIWVRVEVHTQCHSAPLLSTQKKIRRTVVMLYLLQMRAHLLTRLRGGRWFRVVRRMKKKWNEWMNESPSSCIIDKMIHQTPDPTLEHEMRKNVKLLIIAANDVS